MKNLIKKRPAKAMIGVSAVVMGLLIGVATVSLAETTQPASTPATPSTSTTSSTTAATNPTTIDEILISDEPNKDGYVLQGKNTISKNAKKIYATVQLGHATEGSKVIATLIHKDSKAQIGPVVATVDMTGDTMEAFSFTNTSMPWLKGEYEVDVSISNGASKTVVFTVGD